MSTQHDTSSQHVCATCDSLVGKDHPAEWLRDDGTWTHNESDPTIPQENR